MSWRERTGRPEVDASVGRSHGSIDTSDYKNRIEAINYTLAHDDGVTDRDLETADVIILSVFRAAAKRRRRSILAMQFGPKAANFPLIPGDFDRGRLPRPAPERHRGKLFGLTIQPGAPVADSRGGVARTADYASLENCRNEIREAEKDDEAGRHPLAIHLTKSIEEISTTVMQEIRLEKRVFSRSPVI